MTATATAGAAGIRQVLLEAMEADPRVIVLGESVGRLGGIHHTTRGLLDRFGPERVIDTPLSESGLVGFAIGLARAGKIPVIELAASDRLGAAADAIARELVAGGEYGATVILRAPCGGPFDAGPPAGWLASLNGVKIAAACTVSDATGLLRAALGTSGPSILLESISLYGEVGSVSDAPVAFGRARIARPAPAEGAHATALSWGEGVATALAAAESLAADGYALEVLDLRSLSPLDREAVSASVRSTGRANVIDPDRAASDGGGFGGVLLQEILDLAFLYLESPPRALARPSADQLATAFAGSIRY